MLLQKIKTAKVVFPDRKKYKIDYSDELMDLIHGILEKDRTRRLGYKDDFFEILNHPVFKSINIEKLEKKELKPPFITTISDKDLKQYFNV